MPDARKRAADDLGNVIYNIETGELAEAIAQAQEIRESLLAEEPGAAKRSPLDWHTTEGVLTAQEVDRLLTEGMQPYEEAEAIKRTIAGDRESVQRLTALLSECNAACLCGCPADAHESYGEDGESCEDDRHECIRVAPAVLAYVNKLRASLPPEVREAAEEGRVVVTATRRVGDKDTMSFDGTTFTTVRACCDCGVLICGGPTRCLYCAAKLPASAPGAECTGIAASWCPVHGNCSCPRDEEGVRFENRSGVDCPLHGLASNHGDAEVSALAARRGASATEEK